MFNATRISKQKLNYQIITQGGNRATYKKM